MEREQDDQQQALLQQLLGGGGQAVNTTMPVGKPYMPRVLDGTEAAPAPDMSPTKGSPTGMADRKALGGYSGAGTMMGFNTALNYPDDKAATSVKNTFGRIASKYKNAPSSIDAVMGDADFQRFFPGAKKVSGGAGDKIDFGGVLSDFESGVPVGVVDVLGAADPNADTSAGWTWQDEANDGGGAMAADGGGSLAALLGGGQGLEQIDALGNSDVLARILAELQQQGGQGAGDGSQQALVQQLLGGL